MSAESRPVCGFIVVRKPWLSFRPGSTHPEELLHRLDEVYYGGVGRQPWGDISELRSLHRLPPEVLATWMSFDDTYGPEPKVCTDFQLTCLFLEYSNTAPGADDVLHSLSSGTAGGSARSAVTGGANEIVAVKGVKLAEFAGTFEFTAQPLEFLGYEVVTDWGWPLLLEMFLWPDEFGAFRRQLNAHGLFATAEPIGPFVEHYRQLGNQNLVEPLEPSPSGGYWLVDTWRVYRVAASN